MRKVKMRLSVLEASNLKEMLRDQLVVDGVWKGGNYIKSLGKVPVFKDAIKENYQVELTLAGNAGDWEYILEMPEGELLTMLLLKMENK